MEILFYDGHCGLCHRMVRFVAWADTRGDRFRFAPLQGETFLQRILPAQRAALPDSLVLLTADDRLLTRSAGLLHILSRLKSGWGLLAAVMKLFPPAVLDALYDWVARRRLRWFARPADSCPVVAPHLRKRFIR